jgi:hypothetical protein
MRAYCSQTGNVDAGKMCWHFGRWLVGVAKPLKSFVGNGDSGFFRVYSGVGEVGGLSEILE